MFLSYIAKFFVVLFIALSTITSYATVFYSKNEAMVLAFGENAKIETLSLFPDEAQVRSIEALAKTQLESGLFTFYVGKQDEKILGYAAIESSTVRTKPETLMIVLTADGELRNVYTLAFHEPPEYQPPEHWYEQLAKRKIEDLELGRSIDGISGATLSTRSTLAAVRKVMAVYEIMLKKSKDPQ